MKALIVYDSFFGNTEKIALAIGEVLKEDENPVAIRVGEAHPEDIRDIDLLVVGSPTRKFQATPASKRFIKHIPKDMLTGIHVATFDTRISAGDIKSSFLRFLVDRFGYAAKPLAGRLKRKGGLEITPPEGFIVTGTEGPLKEGELKRAKCWGKMIRQLVLESHAEKPVAHEPVE